MACAGPNCFLTGVGHEYEPALNNVNKFILPRMCVSRRRLPAGLNSNGISADAAVAKAGIAEDDIDEGFISLASPKNVADFVGKLGHLRVWGREPGVKMK